MKNGINELQQQPCPGKEYKELEVILNDKGFVSLVITLERVSGQGKSLFPQDFWLADPFFPSLI